VKLPSTYYMRDNYLEHEQPLIIPTKPVLCLQYDLRNGRPEECACTEWRETLTSVELRASIQTDNVKVLNSYWATGFRQRIQSSKESLSPHKDLCTARHTAWTLCKGDFGLNVIKSSHYTKLYNILLWHQDVMT